MQEFAFETPALPLPLTQADRMMHLIIGESFRGMSQAPDMVRVHFEEPLTSEQIAALLSVLQSTAYGLTVLTDKVTVLADNTDTATITISGAVMASDPTLSYFVCYTGSYAGEAYDEGEWATGTAAVTAGSATLTFKTPAEGRYHIIVKRQSALHIGRVGVTAAAP